MANFAYIWGGTMAGIANGTAVTQAALHQLDLNLFKAPNFAEGGTWAPTGTITIGGEGLNIQGGLTVETVAARFYSDVSCYGTLDCYLQLTSKNFFKAEYNCTLGDSSGHTIIVNGHLNAKANVTLGDASGDTIAVNGTATFNGAATFNDSLTANGNTILGSASSDTLTVCATATFSSDVTFGDASTDAVTVNATTTHTSPVIFDDTVTKTSGGQILERTLYLVDASGVAEPGDYEEVIVSGLTDSTKTLDLQVGSAVPGSSITVVNKTIATHYIAVLNDGSELHSLGPMYACKFTFVGGNWTKKYAWLTA